MSGRYDKIIDLPHHRSLTHPRLSEQQRAAQFAPFAALSGYDEAVKESARLTEPRRELAEDSAAELDLRLEWLVRHAAQQPELRVRYFQRDARKPGGAVLTVRGRFKRVDELSRTLCLCGGVELPIEDIYEIE